MSLADLEAFSSAQGKLSIVHGPSDEPLLDFTLAELLDFQCQKFAHQECLVIPWTGARWTYEFLSQESILLARALVERGLRPGDRIAVMAGNCEQYIALFFACMRVGVILVILNNTYTASEALHALNFTDCKILFTTPQIGKHNNRPLLAALKSHRRSCGIVILRGFAASHTHYRSLVEQGSTLSNDLINKSAACFTQHDVCNLQFTSGTTGNPKAAMLTHHSLVNNGRFIGSRMGLTSDDILCCPPPMFHCFGLVLGLIATISHGGKIVYPGETFDPAACLQAICDEDCSAIHGVPAMFDSMFSLPRPEGFNAHRLRTGIIAGAPVPRHLMELLVNEFGMIEYTSSYGLTEASPTCFNALYNDSIDLKLSTVGRIMPHAHAKVIDREGNIVSREKSGELCIAGYQLQRGYWQNHAKTNEVMVRDEDGVLWLHTGDEAVIHDDDTCTITGRFKDIIIRGGENMYPLEIEECLCQHPNIERAIVIGVKDSKYGEVVGTFLQSTNDTVPLGPDEVRQWVRQSLGGHKSPKHIFWLGQEGVSSEVPLTGSGKVRKFEMAKLAEELVSRKAVARL